MPSAFSFIFSDVNGTGIDEISGEFEDITISTQEPGGCLECSFKLYRPLGFLPPFLGANYDLQIQDGQGVFWRGRIERVIPAWDERAEWFEVVAVGYGSHLSDQIDTSENLQNTVTTVGISNVVTNHAPKITATSIEASGYTLSNAAAITRTFDTPAERINFLKEFGYSDDSQMLAHVYPKANLTADNELTVKKRPTAPDYTMHYKECVGRGGFDFANYYNQVVAVYSGGAASTTRNNATGQSAGPDGVNLTKAKLLSIPEITDAADAEQAGDAFLEQASDLRMDVQDLQVPAKAIVLDSEEQRVSPWRIRSGKLMRLIGLGAATGAQSNLAWNNSFVVARTVWDDNSQTLSLTPEGFESTIDIMIAKARHATEAGSRIA